MSLSIVTLRIDFETYTRSPIYFINEAEDMQYGVDSGVNSVTKKK